jgi:hypothetical protein
MLLQQRCIPLANMSRNTIRHYNTIRQLAQSVSVARDN